MPKKEIQNSKCLLNIEWERSKIYAEFREMCDKKLEGF